MSSGRRRCYWQWQSLKQTWICRFPFPWSMLTTEASERSRWPFCGIIFCGIQWRFFPHVLCTLCSEMFGQPSHQKFQLNTSITTINHKSSYASLLPPVCSIFMWLILFSSCFLGLHANTLSTRRIRASLWRYCAQDSIGHFGSHHIPVFHHSFVIFLLSLSYIWSA